MAALIAPATAHEVQIHVAPKGDDAASGAAQAPLATGQAAIDKLIEIAASSPDGDVRVLFHAGLYRIETPLVIQRQHVPAQGSVTLAAMEGENVVLSGGRPITGWTIRSDGTWSVIVPAAAEDQVSIRELFVDGQRRPRARHPNDDYLRVGEAFTDKRSGFTFAAGELPENWTSGGELVFLHDWSTSRIPIKQVAHDTQRLTVEFPIGNSAPHYQIDHFEPHPRYYVENHAAFLDVPGEWLLDNSGTLSYRPLPGEKPESTEVIAPQAMALISVAGDDEAAVKNVHFRDLQFEHCAWQLPKRGFAASQATAYEWREDSTRRSPRPFVPAAIRFERAEDCSFTGGRIAHLGTSGIQFGSRTRRCRLEDSVIEDVSGNAVNLGEDSSRSVEGRPWWQARPDEAAAGHIVQYNRIEHCGQQFFGAVAVWVGLARDMQISNNEIAHHPYTGVSLGWMWNPTPTPAGGNVVKQNHIHHVMQVLSDGGGIYTLGHQPGTRLEGNVIHDVPLNVGRAESNGMFIDEGSDQIEIGDNVIYGVDRSPLRFHQAQQVTVRNNTLVVPTSETPPLRYNNTNPQTIRQLENRVLPQAEFDPVAIERPATGPRTNGAQASSP